MEDIENSDKFTHVMTMAIFRVAFATKNKPSNYDPNLEGPTNVTCVHELILWKLVLCIYLPFS